jgi:hypothetical protein
VPVEAKPLFRLDVLRTHLAAFQLPPHVEQVRPKLFHWAGLISSGRIDGFKEQELLPDFLTDLIDGRHAAAGEGALERVARPLPFAADFLRLGQQAVEVAAARRRHDSFGPQ